MLILSIHMSYNTVLEFFVIEHLYFSIEDNPSYPGNPFKFGGRSKNAISAICHAVSQCCTEQKLSLTNSEIKKKLRSNSNGHRELTQFHQFEISPDVSVDSVEIVHSPKHYDTISDVFVVGPEIQQAPKKYSVWFKNDIQTDPDLQIYRVRVKFHGQKNSKKRKRKRSSE